MANLDDWEELFVQASGSVEDQQVASSSKPPAAAAAAAVPLEQSTSLHQSRNGTSKGKTRKKRKHSASTQAANTPYLEDRKRSCLQWPPWLKIGNNFFARGEDEKKNNMDSAVSSSCSFSSPTGVCDTCQRPTGYHIATLVAQTGTYDNGSTTYWMCKLFCNLRCWSLVQLLDENSCTTTGRGDDATFQRLQLDWHPCLGTTLYYMRSLTSHQSALVERKSAALSEAMEMYSIHQRSKRKSSTQHGLVRLIIACDELYYRLYYVQITMPGRMEGTISLPHPDSYFGLIASVEFKDVEDEARQLVNKLDRTSPAAAVTLSHQIGLDSSTQHNDPLTAIHYYRYMETLRIFSKLSLPIFLSDPVLTTDPHETLGPNLLREWRDSCRDFLCHLYSYATLSASSLYVLEECLGTNNVTRIVEIGAGTGYLAYLLQTKLGLSVQAYDQCPPDSTENEYHGLVPTFVKVQQGTQDVLSTFAHSKTMASQALLLSYPPPDSDFAHDALQLYLKFGGRLMVFIGEFKGLTGSHKLEQFLLQRMECILRLPCLSWATDAATVTLWRPQTSSPASSTARLLIPCTNCEVKESIRRCRYLRSICYCSKTCFNMDERIRTDFRFPLLGSIRNLELEFEKDEHFQRLS